MELEITPAQIFSDLKTVQAKLDDLNGNFSGSNAEYQKLKWYERVVELLSDLDDAYSFLENNPA